MIATLDEVKPNSAEAVKILKKHRLKVAMLTGDNNMTAQYIARQVGIDSVYAQVLPADKEKIVARLQQQGEKVVMVGDGINDAPALVRADVGIAIGSGSDIAVDSADIVLIKNQLTDVARRLPTSAKYRKKYKGKSFLGIFLQLPRYPHCDGNVLLYAVGFKTQSDDRSTRNESFQYICGDKRFASEIFQTFRYAMRSAVPLSSTTCNRLR